jgi:NADPH:quinone reductase-like Zn-dependent oxidoreductase
MMSRLFFGITGPRQQILGTELAGDIEAIGKLVTRFKIGDSVFAFSGSRMGCYAEYKCIPEDGPIALKPSNLTHEEAVALPFGGTTALDFLRRAKLQRGESVLVNGASGAVGTAAVQLAKYYGAEVTAVCSNANVELVRSLGAAHVIDYTKEDFSRSGRKYDLIIDTVGTAPPSRSRKSLTEAGRLLLVVAGLPDMVPMLWMPLTSKQKIVAGPASERADDIRLLADLAEAGHYRPVIDRRYPFEQIVEAHRYVDTGRKRGSVVVMLP